MWARILMAILTLGPTVVTDAENVINEIKQSKGAGAILTDIEDALTAIAGLVTKAKTDLGL